MNSQEEMSAIKLLSVLEGSSPLEELKRYLNEEGDIPQTCSLELMTCFTQLAKQALNKNSPGPQEIYVLQLILNTLQHLAGFDEYPKGLQVLLGYGLADLIKILEKSLKLVLKQQNDAFDGLFEIVLETVVACAEYSEAVRIVMLQQFLDRHLEVVTSGDYQFGTKSETIKSVNLLLEVCPADVGNSLTKSKYHWDLIRKLATLIPVCGDYEYQVALTECLCRLTPKSQRHAVSKTWFTDSSFRKEFLKVKDSNFEEDCRCFLNTVNQKQQSVESFPCRHAFLGNYEIFKPDDPNCTKFWVDFNLGSHRITMFCQQKSMAGEEEEDDNLWQTVSIWEDNVLGYTVKEHEKSVVLHIQTQDNCKELIGFGPYFVDNNVLIEFDAEYPVLKAAGRTFQLQQKYKSNSQGRQHPKVSVSVISEPKSAEMPKCKDSVEQEPALSSQPINISKKKPKLSVPEVLGTPIKAARDMKSQKPKEAITPGNSRIKPKRVKTPLQMVDSPIVSLRNLPTKDHHKPKPKVSISVADSCRSTPGKKETLSSKSEPPERTIHKKQQLSRATTISSDDNVIPSSAPEEQVMAVPDSQPSYLQNLSALSGKSRRIRDSSRSVNDSGVCLDVTDDTVDGFNLSSEKMHQLKHELEKMDSDFTSYPRNVHKVSTTPCLSTVSEESGPGSSRLGSQPSRVNRLATIHEAKGSVHSDCISDQPDQASKSRQKMANGSISNETLSNGEKQREKPVCMSPDSTSADVVCSGGGVASQDLFITQNDNFKDKASSSQDQEPKNKVSQEVGSQRQTRSKRNGSNLKSIEDSQVIEENDEKCTKASKKSNSKKLKGHRDKSMGSESAQTRTTAKSTNEKNTGVKSPILEERNKSTEDEFVRPLPILPRKKKESASESLKSKARNVMEPSTAGASSLLKQHEEPASNESSTDFEFVKPFPVFSQKRSRGSKEEAVNVKDKDRKKKSKKLVKPTITNESCEESREFSSHEDNTKELRNNEHCEFAKPFPVSDSANITRYSDKSVDADNHDISQISDIYNFSQESLYSTYSQDPCLMTRNNKLAGMNLSLDRQGSKLSIKKAPTGKTGAVKPKFFKARARERQDISSQRGSISSHHGTTSDDTVTTGHKSAEETKIQKANSFNKSNGKQQPGKNQNKEKTNKQKAGKVEKLSKLCVKLKDCTSDRFKEDVNCAFGFDEHDATEALDVQEPRKPEPAKEDSPELPTKSSKTKTKKKKKTASPTNTDENSDNFMIEDSGSIAQKDVENMLDQNIVDDGTLSSSACGVISDFKKVCQKVISGSNSDRSNRTNRKLKKVNYKDPVESDLDFETTQVPVENKDADIEILDVKYSDNKNIKVHETSKKRSKKGRRHIFSDTGDDTFETRSEVSWIFNSSTKKKKPKIDKTYPAKPHVRDRTKPSTRTDNVDSDETDEDSENENFAERRTKPVQKVRTKRKRKALSVRNEAADESSSPSEDSADSPLFSDRPLQQKQDMVKLKLQHPSKKRKQRAANAEKTQETGSRHEAYEDALDETLIVENREKTPKMCVYPNKHKRSSGGSDLEQTLQNLCSASVQALTSLGADKAKRSNNKTTACVVNDICSEDFATELRSMFNKAINANKIMETPKTTVSVKKKTKQSKKTPTTIKSKKYNKLDVQIVKTPVINSICGGLMEDEPETFRFEQNLNNLDSVTISPIMPIAESTKERPSKKENEKRKTQDKVQNRRNMAEENEPDTNVLEEGEEEEVVEEDPAECVENVQLSQNSNFSHISTLKTPKTPFTLREVEMEEAEDQYNPLYQDVKSGPSRRRKKRSYCESVASSVTAEENEGDDEDLEAPNTDRPASTKMLKPRQLFTNYSMVECNEPESEEEIEEEEEEEDDELDEDQAAPQMQVGETSLFRPDFTDTGDSALQTNVKSMIQTFGSDIQRNLMAKTKFIEGLTKSSLKVTQKQVGKTWNRHNSRRHEVLEDFKNTLTKELKLLEDDMINMKQAEHKVLECFRSTLEVIQSGRQKQEKRLQNLANAKTEFEEEMANVQVIVEAEKESLQESMKEEMMNLQKKILRQSQQQEICNVKKTLSAIFL